MMLSNTYVVNNSHIPSIPGLQTDFFVFNACAQVFLLGSREGSSLLDHVKRVAILCVVVLEVEEPAVKNGRVRGSIRQRKSANSI